MSGQVCPKCGAPYPGDHDPRVFEDPEGGYLVRLTCAELVEAGEMNQAAADRGR